LIFKALGKVLFILIFCFIFKLFTKLDVSEDGYIQFWEFQQFLRISPHKRFGSFGKSIIKDLLLEALDIPYKCIIESPDSYGGRFREHKDEEGEIHYTSCFTLHEKFCNGRPVFIHSLHSSIHDSGRLYFYFDIA
jgi:hypothetical protein